MRHSLPTRQPFRASLSPLSSQAWSTTRSLPGRKQVKDALRRCSSLSSPLTLYCSLVMGKYQHTSAKGQCDTSTTCEDAEQREPGRLAARARLLATRVGHERQLVGVVVQEASKHHGAVGWTAVRTHGCLHAYSAAALHAQRRDAPTADTWRSAARRCSSWSALMLHASWLPSQRAARRSAAHGGVRRIVEQRSNRIVFIHSR